MSELRYSEDHEWISVDAGGNATVGITDHAQEQLGDIVYVELPEVGLEIEQGDDVAVVESVKAAADVKSPASGTVSEVNDQLTDQPDLVNREPTGEGWFFRLELSDPSEIDDLMNEDEYAAFVKSLE
jgi:glycine cleavage system H protein